jgi:hypothetical protein
LIILMILEKSTSYEDPHYAISPTFFHFISLQFKYAPQHPVLKYP